VCRSCALMTFCIEHTQHMHVHIRLHMPSRTRLGRRSFSI
jgi:hypothetical protein